MGGYSNNKFNFVQLRPHHNIDYYIFICYYINEENLNKNGEEFIFNIPKNDIINLIEIHGHYAHGTKKNLGLIKNIQNSINVNKEYALRCKYNDLLWKKLINYQINDLHNIIII